MEKVMLGVVLARANSAGEVGQEGSEATFPAISVVDRVIVDCFCDCAGGFKVTNGMWLTMEKFSNRLLRASEVIRERLSDLIDELQDDAPSDANFITLNQTLEWLVSIIQAHRSLMTGENDFEGVYIRLAWLDPNVLLG